MILDVCCGPKMMWFNKNESGVIYGDMRNEHIEMSGERWEREWDIEPDVIYDFAFLPFKGESFDLVVFDPPHLKRLGKTSFLAQKYGVLFPGWEEQLKEGFSECLRVLKENGTLIFKWNETDFSVSKVIEVLGHTPLFGHKSGKASKTHWLTFMKQHCQIAV